MSIQGSTLLYLCLLTVVVIEITYGCCTPDQWEGKVGIIGGVASSPPRPLSGTVSASYDYTNKRQAQVVDATGQSIRIVSDYNEGKMYIITGSSCKYYNITKTFPRFCTDGTMSIGSYELGLGDETLSTNGWLVQTEKQTITISTTPKLCIPLSEAIFGESPMGAMVATFGYVNLAAGIKDPSIFNHPDSCQPALKVLTNVDNDLKSLGISDGASYWIQHHL